MPSSLKLLTEHQSIVKQLRPYLEKKVLPQALLIVGPRYSQLERFASYLSTYLLCSQPEPCGVCPSCNMILEECHPDVSFVRAEQDKNIKIDQIRAVQENVFYTPKKAKYRFVIFSPADKMNTAAANALLKVLEEPPAHTLFILLAEQVKGLPATILSRCQQFTLSFAHPPYYPDLLEQFFEGGRAQLKEKFPLFLDGFIKVLKRQQSPCSFASSWVEYGLEDVLWLLYLIIAECLKRMLCKNSVLKNEKSFSEIGVLTNVPLLYSQLDQIHALLKKIHHNINSNSLLSLENIMIGFVRGK